MRRRAFRCAGSWVLDSGPVVGLAAIAAVGSFTHIRDLAAGHGQAGWMAWAVAVCIDLLCVMAARERHRDRRTGRARRGWVSWPTLVLAGGVVLTLAANLAEAEHSPWGYIVAGTPAAAFLVAVSMLERRAATQASSARPASSAAPVGSVPVEDETPGAGSLPVPADRVAAARIEDGPSPTPAASSGNGAGRRGLAGPLVAYARHADAEHRQTHGRPITRDQLRARLRVSNDLAGALLNEIRATDAR